MLKIVHCADLHLTEPSEGQKAVDCFVTFTRIIDFTNQQHAHLLLIAGDLYDSIFASQKLIASVQNELARCRAQIYICGGNHDYCGINSPLNAAGYSENVHILAPGKITTYPLPQFHSVLYGCSFGSPHTQLSPLYGFEAKEDGLFHIGLLHGDSMRQNSDYAPMTIDQIDHSNLHYLALGHVHSADNLPCSSKTIASYPGTPQSRRFGESGGVNLVMVENGAVTLTHHDLSVRHYLTLTVSISDCKNDSDVASAVFEQVNCIDTPAECCCRITLTGKITGSYHPQPKVIEQLLSKTFYQISVKNKTITVPDPNDPAFAYSLQGLFLQEINQRLADCNDIKQRKFIQLAKLYGSQAFYQEVNIDAD